MIKATAIVLLLSFSNLLVLDSGLFSIAEIDGLEIFENDSEKESEKDNELEENEKSISENPKNQFASIESMQGNLCSNAEHESHRLLRLYQEIPVPPPEH
ncbi:hypothetical protein [Roseivirga misakiensis]|uniref:Uncharacterized protein n=1 Tax=Roseivirga misakiensis TaxID=1563681 RepID=A0A1E5T1V3_9BACT|nr:hypothetical protein [Roseivirga misakiensis]OEK05350.1 hypothetical protein BFP71_18325 [Roseivirga misakiensis]